MSEIVDPRASDLRRNWGLFFLAGGGVSMTAMAGGLAWAFVYSPWPATTADARIEWLGWALIGSLGLVGIVLTGFAGLLVKRTIRLSKDGLEVSDKDGVA